MKGPISRKLIIFYTRIYHNEPINIFNQYWHIYKPGEKFPSKIIKELEEHSNERLYKNKNFRRIQEDRFKHF